MLAFFTPSQSVCFIQLYSRVHIRLGFKLQEVLSKYHFVISGDSQKQHKCMQTVQRTLQSNEKAAQCL